MDIYSQVYRLQLGALPPLLLAVGDCSFLCPLPQHLLFFRLLQDQVFRSPSLSFASSRPSSSNSCSLCTWAAISAKSIEINGDSSASGGNTCRCHHGNKRMAQGVTTTIRRTKCTRRAQRVSNDCNCGGDTCVRTATVVHAQQFKNGNRNQRILLALVI